MNKKILIALFIFGMSTTLNAKEIRFECFYGDYKEYRWSNHEDEWKRRSPDTVGGTTIKIRGVRFS